MRSPEFHSNDSVNVLVSTLAPCSAVRRIEELTTSRKFAGLHQGLQLEGIVAPFLSASTTFLNVYMTETLFELLNPEATPTDGGIPVVNLSQLPRKPPLGVFASVRTQDHLEGGISSRFLTSSMMTKLAGSGAASEVASLRPFSGAVPLPRVSVIGVRAEPGPPSAEEGMADCRRRHGVQLGGFLGGSAEGRPTSWRSNGDQWRTTGFRRSRPDSSTCSSAAAQGQEDLPVPQCPSMTRICPISAIPSRILCRRFFGSTPKAWGPPETRVTTVSGSVWITCPRAD